MHRFKDSYNQIVSNTSNETNKLKSITFYDCMASLLSIYVDISLDLKTVLNYLTKHSNKKRAFELLKFKMNCLTTNMCLNIFYLLGN